MSHSMIHMSKALVAVIVGGVIRAREARMKFSVNIMVLPNLVPDVPQEIFDKPVINLRSLPVGGYNFSYLDYTNQGFSVVTDVNGVMRRLDVPAGAVAGVVMDMPKTVMQLAAEKQIDSGIIQ